MVPLKYNVRSLRARKVGSLMTIFGIAGLFLKLRAEFHAVAVTADA